MLVAISYLPHPRTYQAALGQASRLSSFSVHLPAAVSLAVYVEKEVP